MCCLKHNEAEQTTASLVYWRAAVLPCFTTFHFIKMRAAALRPALLLLGFTQQTTAGKTRQLQLTVCVPDREHRTISWHHDGSSPPAGPWTLQDHKHWTPEVLCQSHIHSEDLCCWVLTVDVTWLWQSGSVLLVVIRSVTVFGSVVWDPYERQELKVSLQNIPVQQLVKKLLTWPVNVSADRCVCWLEADGGSCSRCAGVQVCVEIRW